MEVSRSSTVYSRSALASPWDRLAAFVVDLVFLFPFLQIFQAPWRRSLQSALLVENVQHVSFLQWVLPMIAIVCFVVYRSVCHYLWGCTLGKHFYGLRVRGESGRLSALTSVLRPLYLLAEVFLLGIPLLAIFYHRSRRPLHSRMTDTWVTGEISYVRAPGRRERFLAIALGICVAFGVMGLFVADTLLLSDESPSVGEVSVDSHDREAMALLIEDLEALESESDVAKVLGIGQSSEDCEIFQEITGGDMVAALQAFSLQQIDNRCLMSISQTALWQENSPLLANLGVAFGFGDQEEKAEPYAAEVCRLAPSSAVCGFVEWAANRPMDSDPQLGQIRQVLQKAEVFDFFRIYFVRALQKHGQYHEAEKVLKSFQSPEESPGFLSQKTFLNLLYLKKWESAYWVYRLGEIAPGLVISTLADMKSRGHFEREALQSFLLRIFPQIGDSSLERQIAEAEPESPQRAAQDLWNALEDAK